MEKRTFTAPSGKEYTIRQQNGNDDDILSNSVDAQQLKNLSNFIAAIVINTNATENGRLTQDQAHKLPALDRYCILFHSRIFSLGETLEFTQTWSKDVTRTYEQDLNEFLFDYSKPFEEQADLDSKPNAIPYYPLGDKLVDIEIKTSSGLQLTFDVMTGAGEAYFLNLPKPEQTRNAGLRARNLKLLVKDKYELVTNFSKFTVHDMREIRRSINTYDPVFQGLTDIENPMDGSIVKFPILELNNFFYLGED